MGLQLENKVYLVIDVTMDQQRLLRTLALALESGVVAVQVWGGRDWDFNYPFLRQIIALCKTYMTPVLMNNHWTLVQELDFDGVHFDAVPADWKHIRSVLGTCLYGITCNNDLAIVEWANTENLNYISFCSVFPSQTSNSCELVDLGNLRFIRDRTDLPIFLAGGITLEKLPLLQGVTFDCIAVISGIMSSETPVEALAAYKAALEAEDRYER